MKEHWRLRFELAWLASSCALVITLLTFGTHSSVWLVRLNGLNCQGAASKPSELALLEMQLDSLSCDS